MALTFRKRALFALIAVVLSLMASSLCLLAADVILHKRAERSAGLNIWGYRGPLAGAKRANELRLAVLGGSTVFGYGLPWSEAVPAVLARTLEAQRGPAAPVSVVNLGFNNEGAYSYRFTLDDFHFLDYDVAILFDGYNDMAGDDGPNLRVYRHSSPVFRLTGYFPILPLWLGEKALAIRAGGNVQAGYLQLRGESSGQTVFTPSLADRTAANALESASRVSQALGRQLNRVASPDPSEVAQRSATSVAGCAYPWSWYCDAMFTAITHARGLGVPVVVVLQPRLGEPATKNHIEQQGALAAMIARHFASDPKVALIDLSGAIDVTDTNLSFDGMHLSTDGTVVAVDALAKSLQPLLARWF